MEFTQVLKKGSAILFLVLLTHGLVLGFTTSSTILNIVLAAVVCLFEAQLVKSERIEQEKRLNNMLTEVKLLINKVSEKQSIDHSNLNDKLDVKVEELIAKINNTDSKISTIKISQGIKRL